MLCSFIFQIIFYEMNYFAWDYFSPTLVHKPEQKNRCFLLMSLSFKNNWKHGYQILIALHFQNT